MRRTIFEVAFIARPMGWLSRAILRLLGWRMEGPAPEVSKCVVVVAPHTSNWDFPVAMLYAFAFGLNVSFLGKAELFRWPVVGPLFYRLGGIPVERSKAHDVVQSTVRAFDERECLILGIAPEGTRKKVATWKTGFYRIAIGANVPVALAFLDYGRKAGGFGPMLYPTGDIDEDMKVIAAFYAGVTARRPDLTAPPSIPSVPNDATR
jgi:1-acyl-sn-glycerol-3-phosphate acyltransferase